MNNELTACRHYEVSCLRNAWLVRDSRLRGNALWGIRSNGGRMRDAYVCQAYSDPHTNGKVTGGRVDYRGKLFVNTFLWTSYWSTTIGVDKRLKGQIMPLFHHRRHHLHSQWLGRDSLSIHQLWLLGHKDIIWQVPIICPSKMDWMEQHKMTPSTLM